MASPQAPPEETHERPAVSRPPDPRGLGGGVPGGAGRSSSAGLARRSWAISPSLAAGSRSARHLPPRSLGSCMEEVGIEAEILAFNRHVEAIVHEGDPNTDRIMSSLRSLRAGRGVSHALSDEVDAVQWVDPAGPLPSPATPELGEVLARAATIAAAALKARGWKVKSMTVNVLLLWSKSDALISRANWPVSTYCGRSSPRPWTPLLSGEWAFMHNCGPRFGDAPHLWRCNLLIAGLVGYYNQNDCGP